MLELAGNWEAPGILFGRFSPLFGAFPLSSGLAAAELKSKFFFFFCEIETLCAQFGGF